MSLSGPIPLKWLDIPLPVQSRLFSKPAKPINTTRVLATVLCQMKHALKALVGFALLRK
jgi:hypothetical protein